MAQRIDIKMTLHPRKKQHNWTGDLIDFDQCSLLHRWLQMPAWLGFIDIALGQALLRSWTTRNKSCINYLHGEITSIVSLDPEAAVSRNAERFPQYEKTNHSGSTEEAVFDDHT